MVRETARRQIKKSKSNLGKHLNIRNIMLVTLADAPEAHRTVQELSSILNGWGAEIGWSICPPEAGMMSSWRRAMSSGQSNISTDNSVHEGWDSSGGDHIVVLKPSLMTGEFVKKELEL